MRPDEHKRRKNENYKKKHNIAGGKAKESDTKQKNKKDDTKELKKTDKEKQPVRQVKASNETVDVDEDVNPTRRLTDNWDRYEEIEEEERFVPEMRGEDFNTLIAESGGTSSRFRFKDEEDWNDEVAKSGGASQGLTMDFDRLAQAVGCIPLHERLALSKDLFTDEQMEEMSQTADQCQKQYKKVHMDMDLEKENKSPDTTNTHKSAKTAKENTKLTVDNTRNISATSPVKTHNNKHNNAKENSRNVKNETVDKRLETELNSLEDDLDSLLSVDTPVIETTKLPTIHKPFKPTVTNDSATNNNGTVKKESSTEDWLDELLGD